MIRTLAGLGMALAVAGAAAAQPVDERPDPSPIPRAPPGVAQAFDGAFRTDTLELALAPGGSQESEVDYFVRMKAGQVLVYSWRVEPEVPLEGFYADFHGITPGTPPAQVLSYREGTDSAADGSLTAPFDGLHGWLFKNDSAHPVTVKLILAGFYELRSVRETMGLDGPAFMPFGPPGWPDRYGPVQKPLSSRP